MKDSYQYPLLEKISELHKPSQDLFGDVYILACQHILEPQAKMFELISRFGVPKDNIFIFGKIYSTSNEVLDELVQEDFKVSKPTFDPSNSFDVEHRGNCENEFGKFLSSIQNPSKIIILDDGGELLKVVNDKFDSLPSGVGVIGIEQTSSGFRKLENIELHFPVFNVARSAVKLIKESPLIADLGCRRIVDVIKQYSILEPRVLVVGLGPMGSNTLSILNAKGYFSLGHDIAHHDKAELIDLVRNNRINVIVGVTGTNILSERQLQEIKDILDYNLYLISMSSADREFPTTYIRQNGVVPKEIHGDVKWDNLVLINNGFPITFKGRRYESTPEEIERTICLLYGSTLEAISGVSDLKNGFVDVPTEVTNILESHE
jgi:S-adenosylhomocysteine hydrolase